MIYLKVAHTNDSDADYFTFNALNTAVKYIYIETIHEFVLSDIPFEEMPLSDYTFINSELKEMK